MSNTSICLWFDKNAYEAAELYTSIFEDGKILTNMPKIIKGKEKEDQPLVVEFEIAQRHFQGLNGGPVFTKNPSISFFVGCESEEQSYSVWNQLKKGGKILMELGEYPFAPLFGWVEDSFGVSWQLHVTGNKQTITPSLLFANENYGKAKEAQKFYTTVFDKDSTILQEGEILKFHVRNEEFQITESDFAHEFQFNEGISICLACATQEEIDYYWDILTKDGKESQCGWLSDRYGVSWQITPTQFSRWIDAKNPQRTQNVLNAMYKMKKLEIADLEAAYQEKV